MQPKIACSVPVLSLNSKWSLEALLPLLMENFDDVFIVDGNSTDGTQELARSLGVRVEKQFETDEPNQKITHFARMRHKSWDLAKYDWIYWIDADEMPPPEQLAKVREIVAANDARSVHRFIRLAQLPDGRIVQHALFYPEYTPRLFHRGSGAKLVDRPVHEKFSLPSDVRFADHPETYIARWESPQKMWQRQRRYVAMDTESVGASLASLARWVYLYNARSFFGQLYRASRATLIGRLRSETALPWAYNKYFLWYRIFVVIESTRAYMKNPWDKFFADAVREVLKPKTKVLDIGAGLRIDASRGNIEDPTRVWIKPLVAETDYKVMDPVDTYHPDIVGDIHAMPVPDKAYDALICLAVLEHVGKPWVAVNEMRRVLKPGGTLLAYVPFLSPYHAMPGYYGDFYRYTEDGIKALFEDWKEVRVVPVRGPMETLTHLLPRGIVKRAAAWMAHRLDRLRHSSGKQASGFYFTAKKRLS